MKKLFVSLFFTLWLIGCSNQSGTSSDAAEENFISKQENGKWTTDFATAQELKGIHNTIENFTLLNKKKFENLKAYQEFGELIQMQAERVKFVCRMEADAKNLLYKKLDLIKTEVSTLQGNDMEKSEEALKHVNSYLAEIDSGFNYMNR